MKEEQSRLNLRLPTRIIDYLKEMGWRRKKSLTQYLIQIVETDIEKNGEKEFAKRGDK